jgi:hypothetical protein
MAPSLLAVLYRSRAAEQMDRAATLQMLVAAREHNERTGISGLLIRRDDDFMQLVEGPEGPVTDLVARIARDTRHTHFTVLHQEPADHRRFAEWSMAFTDADTLDAALHPGVALGDPFPPDADRSDRAIALLDDFSRHDR